MTNQKRHRPVTIISGFLGSGKTTLLNRILHEKHGLRFAVIVNELGEIGLDSHLITSSSDIVKLDNGCLCCVLSEELVATIAKLSLRDDFDAVILETTGIADPLPIAWPFLRPEFRDEFRFNAIITVVDCLNFETMLTQATEIRMQVERADYVYLTKADLTAEQNVQNVRQHVLAINDNARFVAAADDAFYQLLFDEDSGRDQSSLVSKQKFHSHHDAGVYDSLSIDLNGVAVSLERIEDFFQGLSKDVFRAKAIFKNIENDKTIVMHGVCGRVDFYEDAVQSGTFAAVFIGKKLDKDSLKQKFQQDVLS